MSKLMGDLAAAYTGRRKLPTPHPERVGWPAQLRAAVQQIGVPVPEALEDPILYGPVPEVSTSPACGKGTVA